MGFPTENDDFGVEIGGTAIAQIPCEEVFVRHQIPKTLSTGIGKSEGKTQLL